MVVCGVRGDDGADGSFVVWCKRRGSFEKRESKKVMASSPVVPVYRMSEAAQTPSRYVQ